MNIQDTISDMLNTIKNGQLSNKKVVKCIYSNINKEIINILKNKRYIINYYISSYYIYIYLRYLNNSPIINNIKRISKPSLRIYFKLKDIKNIKNYTFGIYIISTSLGIMTNKLAKKKNIGGEVICFIN